MSAVAEFAPLRGPRSDDAMAPERRLFIQSAAWLAMAGGGLEGPALAEMLSPAYSMDDALAAIARPARESEHVQLRLPERIEDGAMVPVTVTTDLTDVGALYVLADMNPVPIAAQFRLGAGMAPRISVRIKLAGSGRVYGAALRGDGLHWTAKAADVVVGGCS